MGGGQLLCPLHELKERSPVHDGRSWLALGTLVKNTESKIGSSVSLEVPCHRIYIMQQEKKVFKYYDIVDINTTCGY